MSNINEQKFAFISGIATGIGRELAISLAKRGYKVYGCALEGSLWESNDLLTEYGITVLVCDITKIEEVQKLATIIGEKTNGKLDILYNNAGIARGGPAIEMPEQEIEDLFKVNVIGHMYVTKYMAPFVIKAKGRIVFTSSVAARAPLSWMSAYGATKAAIDQYALVLHGEMKPLGVRVHSVITGGVDTGICDSIATNTIRGPYYDVDAVYDSLRASAQMSRNVNISAQEYAEQVTKQVLAYWDPGFNIYRGARAYFLHFLSRFLPLWLAEFGIAFHFRQLKVWSQIRKKLKKE
ncbi:NADPH-dependent 1-acyldihydroxyacetone phosphate reductase [[Candida] anglica]|uniref:NADPH-dependent 1-acyldihydroxyacetone phosphate reductase n=1 Tax=[Candida] anglica TaxID=148631 RepID=A0ABP0EKC6_9ASCO